MKSVRRFACLAVAGLMLLLATSAKAQVLSLLPSEAMVVIKIKNIADTSAKVAVLSQQWGLANIRPELNDPLGTLLTAANIGPGLDKAGDAAVAIMMPEQAGRGEPNMVFLIPVTDFKAFAGALPNSKPEGDLTTFSMGGNPQPGYVADWGKFAAISPQKAMLAKKGGGVQMPAASAKELDAKDVVVFANIKEIRKTVLPLIQQNKGKMLDDVGNAMANGPGGNPKFAPAVKAYIGQFVAAAEEFLSDADGATFGVNLGKDGISTTLLADFNPDSYAGKLTAALKNGDASFTAGLPDGKYFVYGGTVIDPKVSVQLLNDFVAPIEKELTALGADGKPVLDYLGSVRDYISAARQINFGMVAPPANAFGQEGIIQGVSVVTGDTAKLTVAQNKMMATQNELMKLMGADAMGAKTEVKPAAKTVDGVTFDQFTTTFNTQPQTPQEQQMTFLMTMLYGPKGLVAYNGPVGPDKMLGVVGGNDALLTAAVKAAKTNADPLSQGVAAKVSAALPKSRLAAIYLPIDTIATTVLDVMAARGMPGGVKLPPNLPPLGATIASEGSAVRIDGYIPSQTVQSLIAAGMQMWLQGMQGGGAGQPGGL